MLALLLPAAALLLMTTSTVIGSPEKTVVGDGVTDDTASCAGADGGITVTVAPENTVEPSVQVTLATKFTCPLVWPANSVKVTGQLMTAIWPSASVPAQRV